MRRKFLAIGIAMLVVMGIWQVRATDEPAARPKNNLDVAALLLDL